MKSRLARNAALIVVPFLAVYPAFAHTITYEFTGTVVTIGVLEGGSPFGRAQPMLGDPIVGTVTYTLDAPGTPFSGEGDDVNGIDYASSSPPSKMTFTIRDDLTVES